MIGALARQVLVAGVSVFVFGRYGRKLGDLIDRVGREKLPVEVQVGLESGQGGSITDEQATTVIQQGAPELLSAAIGRLRAEYAAEEEQPDAVIPRLIHRLATAEIRADFESIYAQIFGSQIAALQTLREAPDGASRASLEAHLAQVKSNVGTRLVVWLQGLTFEEWFGYLQRRGLAEVDAGGRYRITTTGAGFLAYIEGLGYAPKSF